MAAHAARRDGADAAWVASRRTAGAAWPDRAAPPPARPRARADRSPDGSGRRCSRGGATFGSRWRPRSRSGSAGSQSRAVECRAAGRAVPRRDERPFRRGSRSARYSRHRPGRRLAVGDGTELEARAGGVGLARGLRGRRDPGRRRRGRDCTSSGASAAELGSLAVLVGVGTAVALVAGVARPVARRGAGDQLASLGALAVLLGRRCSGRGEAGPRLVSAGLPPSMWRCCWFAAVWATALATVTLGTGRER